VLVLGVLVLELVAGAHSPGGGVSFHGAFLPSRGIHPALIAYQFQPRNPSYANTMLGVLKRKDAGMETRSRTWRTQGWSPRILREQQILLFLH